MLAELTLPMEFPAALERQEPRFDKRKFRNRLIETRRRRGYRTRRGAATKIGIDEETLRAIEKGRYLPTLGTLILICECYRVSMDWLIWGRNP